MRATWYDDLTLLSTCQQGRDCLSDQTLSFGNFGIQLKDGVCTALAIILASRNVLFIVASGIQQSDADEAF